MPGTPGPTPSPASPTAPARSGARTDLIVRLGLLALLLIGVASIFGRSLLGLVASPDPETPPGTQTRPVPAASVR